VAEANIKVNLCTLLACLRLVRFEIESKKALQTDLIQDIIFSFLLKYTMVPLKSTIVPLKNAHGQPQRYPCHSQRHLGHPQKHPCQLPKTPGHLQDTLVIHKDAMVNLKIPLSFTKTPWSPQSTLSHTKTPWSSSKDTLVIHKDAMINHKDTLVIHKDTLVTHKSTLSTTKTPWSFLGKMLFFAKIE